MSLSRSKRRNSVVIFSDMVLDDHRLSAHADRDVIEMLASQLDYATISHLYGINRHDCPKKAFIRIFGIEPNVEDKEGEKVG